MISTDVSTADVITADQRSSPIFFLVSAGSRLCVWVSAVIGSTADERWQWCPYNRWSALTKKKIADEKEKRWSALTQIKKKITDQRWRSAPTKKISLDEKENRWSAVMMHDDETLRPIFSAGQRQWSWQLISGRHRWWNQMSWSAIFFFVSADRRLYVLWVSATLISADSDSDTHNRWSCDQRWRKENRWRKRKALTKTKIAD